VGQGCGIDVTSDGMQVLVACSSQLAVFSRDPGTGALAFQEVHRDNLGGVDGLGGAWRVIESPDGAHVYTLASLDDAAAVFSRDPGTGALAFVESYADGVGGVQGQDVPAVVAVSPDGAHLYVGAQEWGSTGGSLTVLAVEPTGDLTFVEEVAEGFGPPDGSVSSRAQGVAVSPDGAHVYATDGTDGAVAAFSRDGGTGALAFVERQEDGVGGVDGLAGAWDVALSPDGAHVYVTGPAEAALAVFERNPGTGALGFVEFEQNDFVLGTVDGLWGGASVAVSPDGANVYVAGQEDEALAVFSRDALTGELDFVEVQRDVGMAGGLPSALSSAVSVAVSPDGAHVYAAGYDADAVAVFSRDALTGELDFVEAQRDGMAGAELINAPTDVAVSPDGALVLVTGYENAVTVFRRDAATGSLTWLEEHADGVLSDGLEGANAVRLGADGAFAYVVGLFEQGSAAYRLRAIEPVAAGMGASAFGGSGVAGGLDVAFGAGTGGSLRAQHRRVPLSAAASGLPGPASVDFALAGDPASVWELAFDGAFTGLATLTLGYDGAALLSGASEGDLQVHRFQLGTWTPLAKVGQDPGADTLTVATGDLALSTLALGGPSVLPGSLVFTGSAQGGTIELRVGAVLLVVVTAPGQTPEEVAEAAADAINADPILAAGGVAASSAGPVLEANGAVTSIEVGDPGLGVAPPVAPPVPALPWEGLWWALALVLGALGILAVRRASSPAGRR
jgi:DNA-binding beta-propeller fold protein YncE